MVGFGRAVGELLKKDSEILIRVDSARLCSFDEAIERCCGIRSARVASKQPALPYDNKGTDCILCGVVIWSDIPVFKIANEPGPAGECIAYSFSKKPLGRSLVFSLFQPDEILLSREVRGNCGSRRGGGPMDCATDIGIVSSNGQLAGLPWQIDAYSGYDGWIEP